MRGAHFIGQRVFIHPQRDWFRFLTRVREYSGKPKNTTNQMNQIKNQTKCLTLVLALGISASSFAASWVQVYDNPMNNGNDWNIKNNETRNCCVGIYTDNQVVFGSGLVRIRASGVDYPFNGGTYSYQSGWMDTKGNKFYGANYSVRGRCRIDTRANGVNFGFWLLREDGVWPPEIDIYEYPYAQDQNGSRFKFTVHYTQNGQHLSAGNWKSGVTSTDWAEYRMDRSTTQINALYNGAVFSSVTAAAAIPTGNMYIILSSVVDNNPGWHGTPGSNDWNAAQQCDWVRVYHWQ
jgi:hypothetical protein